MNGSGRAGNGRGNNRRRPFRKRDSDSRPEELSWDGDTRGNNPPLKKSGGSPGSSARRDVSSRRESGGRIAENQGRRGGRRGDDSRSEKVSYIERPKWSPPKFNTEPLPVPTCPWCGKPIRDVSSALADKDSGEAVHFDCVMERIAGGEILEKGDTLSYIGGGRFGILSYDGSGPVVKESRGKPGISPSGGNQKSGQEPEHSRTAARTFPFGARDFKIKKIIEWENKDKRAEWRSVICDHYSVT